MTWSSLLPALCMLALLASPYTSQAESNADRFQFNHDIRIESGERVGDVTCIGCSIHVRGQTSGDVTAIAGSVFAESGASIAGDLTAIGGDARVEIGAQVAGDLTTIGGTLRRDPQTSVAGDVTTVGGRGRLDFSDLPAALPVPRRHCCADHLADSAEPAPRTGPRLWTAPQLISTCGRGSPALALRRLRLQTGEPAEGGTPSGQPAGCRRYTNLFYSTNTRS
jgi:hypothetical protein